MHTWTGNPLADLAAASAILACDYTRGSPSAVGGPGQHKEWQHFVILADEVSALINFSLCDDVRPEAPPGAEMARLVFLARDGRFDGDVDTFNDGPVRAGRGRIDLAFRDNSLRFDGGAFHIRAALEARPLAADLVLVPVTLPAFVPNIQMLDGPPLHWSVVPRLEVSGTLRIGERTHHLDRAPAYHDHNWGHFAWGHDVSWDWGFVLPEDRSVPWCLTFVRLTDRARSVALAQQILLWRDRHMVTAFREHDVAMTFALDHLRPRQPLKVPRAMALVAPETTADVPAGLSVRGRGGADWLDCEVTSLDLSQVLIPSETELGVTIFNEVLARSQVRGRVGGEEIDFTGRSILEFIRYV